MVNKIYRVESLDEIYRVETIEEFYSSESYLECRKQETKNLQRFGYKYTRDLYEYLSQFNLSAQFDLNHIFTQRLGKKLYNAIINIDDKERLRIILYEISMYSKVFTTNAYPDVIQRCMNIINGAIYSPYLEMKWVISDLCGDIECHKLGHIEEEYSNFDKKTACNYVNYFSYIVSGKEFDQEIEYLAKAKKEPSKQFIKRYEKLQRDGEYLLDRWSCRQ